MRSWTGLCTAAGFFTMLAGCSAPTVSALNYSVRQSAVRDRAALCDAAEDVLTRQGYRLTTRDRSGGILVTAPLESAEPIERTKPGVSLSSRGRTRQFAEVRIEDTADGVRVSCKVSVQEQVTQAHQMFRREQGGLDTPSYTPIDRDAATTEEQNTYWQTVRRDRAAERAILDAILENDGTP